MPRNGSGTYSRTNGVNSGPTTWQLDRDAGTKILASRHDTHDQDIADALTASIAKDGQTTPSANMPMGNFRHTGVGDATARTHYAAYGQMQDNEAQWLGTTGGSSNAFTASLSLIITAYVTGMRFSFLADRANTGAATLNIDSVGNTAIVRRDGSTALSSGDIVSGDVHEVIFDGTSFVLLNGAVFTGNVVGNVTGNASTATALQTARAIGIGGSTGLTATGVNFDGTAAINPSLTGTLEIANGGTGQTTAANAFNALKQTATTTSSGVGELATKAEVEARSAGALLLTAENFNNAVGVAKAGINFSTSGGTVTTLETFGLSSLADDGAGLFTANFSTNFNSANVFPAGCARRAATDNNLFVAFKQATGPSASACPFATSTGGGTVEDPARCAVLFFGYYV